MVKPSPVGVAVLGAGGISQVTHLPVLSRMPEARLLVVCDEDLAKAERVAARYNIPHVTRFYEEAVEIEGVDAVDVCLPNHLHAPATLAALDARRHVLCERPFSRHADEAQTMVDAARKKKLVLMGAFNNRFREDARILRKFVAEGELGHVFYVKTGWLMQTASWTPGSWREKKHYAGGGVLLDLGIQMLDLALWVLGMPEVASVSANAHPAPKKNELETTVTALIRLANGGVINLEVAWGLLVERDFAYLNLFGDSGAALLQPLRVHKELHGSLVNVTPSVPTPKNLYKQSYQNEIKHFLECVRTGRAPESPGSDALAVLRLLEALYRSAAEGKEVHLR